MIGHILKRVGKNGTSWRIVVSAGSDAATGQRRKVTETVRGSYRDAQRRMREIGAAIEGGSYMPSRALTLEKFIGTWWPTKRISIAATTRQNYEIVIRLHILPRLAGC